jgi:CAAX protease family protein
MPDVRPQRQVVVFLSIIYVLAVAIALLFASSGMAPFLVIPIPALATVAVIAFVVPAADRRRVVRELGLGRPGLRLMPAAILIPGLIAAASFATAAALGVLTMSIPGLRFNGSFLLTVVVTFVLWSFIFLGEEIGWRGFLLPRLAEVMPFRRAAMLVGVAQWAYHVPLYLTASGYMSGGSRWIVVPVALVMFVAGGVFYAWLRAASGSLWPVTVAHNAFNTWFEGIGRLVVTASSPAAVAYVLGETGIATMVLSVVAAWVLLRRSRVFRDTARPSLAPDPAFDRTPHYSTR